MRRLLDGVWGSALWMVAVLALPAPATCAAAEHTMRFRPVPAESASSLSISSEAPADSLRRGRTSRVPVVVPPAPAVETPAVPEPPEVPEPPARTTSGDLVRFGSDITVKSGQLVQGDVVSFGGSIEVIGHVTGNVSAMGGDVTLSSSARVDGDVVCIGGTLREEPGSSVGGQRVTAPRTPGAKLFFPMLAVVGTGFQMLAHAAVALFMLGIAWLFAKLAPGRTQAAMDLISAEAGPSFIIGLLLWALIIPSVIAMALVVAVLCITIIGIPLAVAVAVGYCAFFVLAALWGVVVGYGVLGQRLYPRFKGGTATLLQSLVWGAIALQGIRIVGDLFHVVPLFGFVGGLLTFIHFVLALLLGTLGAGALVRGEYQRRSLQNWWSRMRPAGTSRNDVPPPPSPPPPPPVSPAGSGAEVIS
jgi:hypothetical protein